MLKTGKSEFRLRCHAAAWAAEYGGTVKGTTDNESGVRIVRPADFNSRGHAEPHFVTGQSDLTSMRRLQRGDIVVALAGPIGEAMVVGDDLVGAVLGRWCAALRARSDQTAVTTEWLYGWTQSTDFREQVEKWTMAAATPRLPEPALRSFSVPVPDESNRLQLEAMVTTFDEVIGELERSLQLTRELRALEIDLLVAGE